MYEFTSECVCVCLCFVDGASDEAVHVQMMN